METEELISKPGGHLFLCTKRPNPAPIYKSHLLLRPERSQKASLSLSGWEGDEVYFWMGW